MSPAVDWTTIKPGLLTLIGRLAGSVLDFTVSPPTETGALGMAEADAAQPAMGNTDVEQASGVLSFICRPVNRWRTYEPLDGAPDGDRFEHTYQESKISVLFRVDSYEQIPGLQADEYLERARPRLSQEDTRVILAAMGLALIEVTDTTPINNVQDNEVYSSAGYTIQFRHMGVAISPTPYSSISYFDPPTHTGDM